MIPTRGDLLRDYDGARCAALVGAVLTKRLTFEDFVERMVGFLAATRALVAVRADALVAKEHGLDPLGWIPRDYSARDRASLATALEEPRNDRLQRFALATVEQYARDVVIDLGQAHGASGWVWRTVRQGCDECGPLDGTRHDIDEPMLDHPHCRCWPELIFSEEKKR